MIDLTCHNCTSSDMDIFTTLTDPACGWPKYWFGGIGPNNPETAEFYFCGSECATEHYDKERGTKHEAINDL